jgi:tetratricopeptide (TPR) repeat protein
MTGATLESYSILAISMLRQSRLKAALQTAQDGLTMAQSLGDRLHEGIILNSMGMIAFEGKDPTSALDYLEKALQIAREIKQTELEIKVANNLGNVAGSLRGDFSVARRYYEQAIAIVHQWGDRYAEGLLLSNLAWVMGMQGDLGSARVYHQQALIIAREIGNPYQEAYTLINLSSAAAVQGDSAAASETARQAYDISQKLGDHRGESLSLLNLGHAMFQAEEFEQARDAYTRCIEVSKRLELPGFEIEPMAGLLQVALQMGNAAELKQWTGEVLTRMENGALEGAEEPLRVYHSCYEALLSMKDPRASTLLQEAARFLELQISKIPEQSARDMFVNNMPWRHAIWNAWEAIR